MLDHYVAFKARPGRDQDLSEVLRRFTGAISGQLQGLLDISAGSVLNQAGRDLGYTHGCHVRLSDAETLRDAYWNHPAHQALLAELDAVCAERFALDYIGWGES
jgi:hypothetical protein